MHWYLLAFGIVLEVGATTSLKLSDGFTKLGFAALALLGFAAAFYMMSLVVRTMPVGIAYSVWAGAGIAAITLVGALAFGERIDLGGYLGIGLITAGVIVLNLVSQSASG
ncbi:MAG: multidrug efflux SMR transporter [Paracoccaceae bacterium]|nr:multidrug efflux SMR transporter [Paracoccaceae bacterium]